MRRVCASGGLIAVVAAAAVATASSYAADTPAPSPAQPDEGQLASAVGQGVFAQASVNAFTRDLARVGIGVYAPGASRPVLRVRGPVSPLRLSTSEAQGAALGAASHTGMSGAKLNELMGKVRLTRRVKVPVGTVISGWARHARTPSARLARRILGRVNWRRYKTIVFPNAVTMLFASDIAVQFRRPGMKARRAIAPAAHTSAGTPCTDALAFVDNAINSFFDWIGHLHTPRSFIEKVFGRGSFGARLLIGISDYVTGKVNALIDKARELVLEGVRLPLKFVTEAVAGVAATVNLVSSVATIVVAWKGTVWAAPNPISKGVGDAGIPGVLLLGVDAPLNFTWPPELVNCAKELANFEFPSTKPTGGQVSWKIEQYPGGLIRTIGDSTPINENSLSQQSFETTTETPEQAKGKPALGLVVAVATVQRTDLDRLVKLVTDTVFAVLPDVIRKSFGKQLRDLAAPLIDKATKQFRKLRDVEATGRLLVRYHVPKPERTRRQEGKGGAATGTWDGTWHSNVYDIDGTMVMRLEQTATKLSGTLTIAGADCVSKGTMTGEIRNGHIHVGAIKAEYAVSYDGRISGNRMAGTWKMSGCTNDRGTWAAQRR